MKIRRNDERGHAEHGWLDSHHTFSFANYHDPKHMGWRALRVINEDRVVPGAGFGAHPHRDMEIISYVLEGGLEHKDSMGTGSIIRPGEVQRMSAGTGVFHSEFNASKSDPVHFLQIWLLPSAKGLEPGYQQKAFDPEKRRGEFKPLVSPDGREGSLRMNQDAVLSGAFLEEGKTLEHTLGAERYGWLHLARGSVAVNGEALNAGDGIALDPGERLAIEGLAKDSELLLFDLS
ncbi:MAG: pirin family protein [Myxococcota bacterium]